MQVIKKALLGDWEAGCVWLGAPLIAKILFLLQQMLLLVNCTCTQYLQTCKRDNKATHIAKTTRLPIAMQKRHGLSTPAIKTFLLDRCVDDTRD
jgi:hypothetical protein